MDGVFNTNFLVGMLLARDLPRQEQLITGLAAGQMPPGSPIGPILLKPIIDQRTEAEKKRVAAEATAGALRDPIEIELPAGASTAIIRTPGTTANLTIDKSTTGVTLDPKTGTITLPNDGAEATVLVANNGAVRTVTIVRGARSQVGSVLGRGLTAEEITSARRLLELIDAAGRSREGDDESGGAFRRAGSSSSSSGREGTERAASGREGTERAASGREGTERAASGREGTERVAASKVESEVGAGEGAKAQQRRSP